MAIGAGGDVKLVVEIPSTMKQYLMCGMPMLWPIRV